MLGHATRLHTNTPLLNPSSRWHPTHRLYITPRHATCNGLKRKYNRIQQKAAKENMIVVREWSIFFNFFSKRRQIKFLDKFFKLWPQVFIQTGLHGFWLNYMYMNMYNLFRSSQDSVEKKTCNFNGSLGNYQLNFVARKSIISFHKQTKKNTPVFQAWIWGEWEWQRWATMIMLFQNARGNLWL